MTGTMSKALKAAHQAGILAATRGIGNGDDLDLEAYRDAFLAHLAEDEAVVERLADVIADTMNMNRAGRLEREAALAVLEKLIARAQS